MRDPAVLLQDSVRFLVRFHTVNVHKHVQFNLGLGILLPSSFEGTVQLLFFSPNWTNSKPDSQNIQADRGAL